MDLSKARSLQQAIRTVAESEGMEWVSGISRAYKDRSPGGKVGVKLDYVKVRQCNVKAIKAALEKEFPTAVENYVSTYGSVNVWFDEDPGIGAKISESAYQKRVDTLAKDIKALVITSGKSKTQVLKDLKEVME